MRCCSPQKRPSLGTSAASDHGEVSWRGDRRMERRGNGERVRRDSGASTWLPSPAASKQPEVLGAWYRRSHKGACDLRGCADE